MVCFLNISHGHILPVLFSHASMCVIPGHEGAIKCMCLDPSEEYFCTGSADGDIKVWDFNGKPRAVFHGEHSRSGFFKNIPGQGVTQLSLDNHHRLFSCGADGSVKIRVLTDKYD